MVNLFHRLASACLLGASLLPFTSRAQCNLIPNGGFEQANNAILATSSNIGPGTADDLTGWNSPAGNSDYWGQNASGTTNYSNILLTPHAGNGCVGLFAAYGGGPDYNQAGPLEYVALNNSIHLTSGHYYASFYAQYDPRNVTGATPQRLGMNVTRNTNVAANAPGPVASGIIPPAINAPSVYNFAQGIQSSAGVQGPAWTQVNGIIPGTLAEGWYDINLGNLSPAVYRGAGDGVYYFIDDVELYRLPEAIPGTITSCSTAGVLIGTGCTPIPGATYQWFTGGAAIRGATSVTYSVNPKVTTSYTLQVTLPTTPVQTYTTSATVTVEPPPTAQAGVTICAGNSVTLSPTCINTTKYIYQWSEGPSYTTSLPGTSITVSPSTTTTYQLAVTTFPERTGTTTYSYVTVTVIPAPAPPQLTVLNDDQCLKNIKYHIANYDPALTYTITVAGDLVQPATPVGQDFTIQGTSGSAGGTFTLTVTNNTCGFSASITTTITFGPPTAPQVVQVVPSGQEVDCPDNSEWYSILNFDPTLKYVIQCQQGSAPLPGEIGNGTNWPTLSGFRIKGGAGRTEGFFTITATNQCFLTSAIQDEPYHAVFPICPPPDRVAAPGAAYTLYPNPATDEVLIQAVASSSSSEKVADQGISNVRVYDGQGQLRLEQRGEEATSMRLHVDQLPAGLYLVQVLQGKTIVSRQRLQVGK